MTTNGMADFSEMEKKCRLELGMNFTSVAIKYGSFIAMLFLSSVLHTKVLKRYAIPRIALEILLGILFGSLQLDVTTKYLAPGGKDVKKVYTNMLPELLEHISEFIMVCNMYVLGLEMEATNLIFRRPTREHIVSYVGMLTAFIFAFVVFFFTNLFTKDVNKPKDPTTKKHSAIELVLGMSITVAGTASPVLTRMMTDAKIGQTDIGKFAVATAMHTDFVFSVMLCIGFIYHLYETGMPRNRIGHLVSVLVVQIAFASKVGPIFLNWVNSENPEGKQMKGPHLVFSLAFMVLITASSTSMYYNSVLSAFIVGFCLPREGRVSRMMISKINYLLSNIFYPTYFLWIGMITRSGLLEPGRLWLSIMQLVVLLIVTVVGKAFGTLLSCMQLGFQWPEALALGLLLSMKGHFHLYIAVIAMRTNYLYTTTCLMFVIVVLLTCIYTPAVVALIKRQTRKRSPNKKMALQWLDPTSDLRMMLCVRNTKNVPSCINFIEILRGTAEAGLDVYVTDMIELTERVAATLVQGEGMQTVTVSDRAVNEMREQISDQLQAYLDENDEGITLKRMLTLSNINNMHQKICVLAEELMVSLIVLPFYKLPREDGNLDEGHPGFRFVTQKVLQQAPCSVGILVDRGLGLIARISRTYPSLNAAVIFIGGKDDREALAYASCVARHPGVNLTVIRLLLDTTAGDNASTSEGVRRVNVVEKEDEMKLDDESFAEFYDRQVAGGHVNYMEKYLANSSETLSTLKLLEGQYELIIIGRGRRVNSTLTLGMNDWEQCPELGRIGDILSSAHFSSTASVLIIQQHSLRKELELDVLDDEFTNM